MNLINSRFTTQGFSLIEVLVALAVLSIGLLGLAALQTTGLKFNHQSYERTQAVLQSYDIIDRIRANRSGVNRTINTTYNDSLSATAGTTDCTTTSCTGDQLAQFDIRQWNSANATLLNQGAGAICKGTFTGDPPSGCTADPNISIYRVAITWRESDLNMRFDVEAQP